MDNVSNEVENTALVLAKRPKPGVVKVSNAILSEPERDAYVTVAKAHCLSEN